MKRTSTAIALIMAVSATPALAQVTWTYSDVDQDGNLELTDREFQQVSRDTFGRYDVNQDEILDENEFGAFSNEYGVDVDYASWATDDEGVDWEEFHQRLFATYDADQDEVLSENEYGVFEETAGFNNEGLGSDVGLANDNETLTANRVISLSEWGYDEFYTDGLSVDALMSEGQVYGPEGESIGEVEDVLIGTRGDIVAVIAEVGGFWDIGDTHVSVPWDAVRATEDGQGIIIPVTEDNVGEYSVYDNQFITRDQASDEVIGQVDDVTTTGRMWRATEMIGDYARIRDGEGYANFGYVSDMLIRDGEVAAVVVQPNAGFGMSGTYAYPYYGYGAGYGWTPGSAYYNMPYDQQEIGAVDQFDYAELDAE